MRIPTATYRLQLNHRFRFCDAEAILDYLHRLGISDIYASPVFCANPGSLHGYDMTDPTRINPELGTPQDFQQLLQCVRDKKMGWLQDFAPNHMAYSHHNPWLMDVLEYGLASPYCDFFDIQWDHPDPDLYGKVLAPFLGQPLQDVIDAGQLKLNYGPDGFAVTYYDRRFPVNGPSLSERLEDAPVNNLESYFSEWAKMKVRDPMPQRNVQLFQWVQNNTEVRTAIDTVLDMIQSDTKLLKRLMDSQYYHLAHWKTAQEKINYRRFFYINDLICLNIERPEVFQAVHAGLGGWIEEGLITGLRIDHLDGLKYPERYLNDLRSRFGDLYIVAEKILEKDETVPDRWPLQGTTGYDFANYTTAVFCDHRHQHAFMKHYSKLTGQTTEYHQLLFEQKKKVITRHMQGDIANLMRALQQTAAFSDGTTDAAELAAALIHLIAAFGVYRTYRADHAPTHREYLSAAVSQAQKKVPHLFPILDIIEQIFLSPDNDETCETFMTRFRQITGPAMAKGFEDTLLYLYYPLIALNEVGSMPEVFGISVRQFHEFNGLRLKTPHTMNATSTHDTKRGEDVRARINILSEMPRDWFDKVAAWRRLNEPYKTVIDGRPAPDANDEYMLYQTILGALPLQADEYPSFHERLKAYLVKSIREAKVHSSWIEPNQAYEQAALDFLEKLFDPTANRQFLSDLQAFGRRIHESALMVSCGQTLLKMTCPGVPDCYQGTETWDLSLVDPDNRRPVDYEKRKCLLDQLTEPFQKNRSDFGDRLYSQRDTGLMKLFIIRQTLHLRQQFPELFTNGDYIPIDTEGPYKEHLIACARVHHRQWAMITVPRLPTGLCSPGQMPLGEPVWKDTKIRLPQQCQTAAKELFTAASLTLPREVYVKDLLATFPVSLWYRK